MFHVPCSMKERGFTIIELIISISILSLAIVGIFSAFSMMTILTSDSADRLTATYLAQEGMEIVRNIRDTNWLNMDTCSGDSCDYTWVDGLTAAGIHQSIDCTQGCQMDYRTGAGYYFYPVAPYSGEYLNLSTGFYDYYVPIMWPGYSSNIISKFKRKIIITPITDVDGKSDHIIKVKVEVTWDEKANILNPIISADFRDPLTGNCDPKNCIAAEGTLYNWYNYVNQ